MYGADRHGTNFPIEAYCIPLSECPSGETRVSEEQLQFQQSRYAVGAADLLLLMDAQTNLSTAEQGYLNAVYEFHYSLIALEASAGQSLRSR